MNITKKCCLFFGLILILYSGTIFGIRFSRYISTNLVEWKMERDRLIL